LLETIFAGYRNVFHKIAVNPTLSPKICLKCVEKALDTTDLASAQQTLDGARTHKFLDRSLLTDGWMFRLDWAM